MTRPTGTSRGARVLRVAAWGLVLLGSFAAVVWRQTRGVALERELRALQNEIGIAEARKLELVTRVHELSNRRRIVRVAGERLKMHLPEDQEIVLLAAPAGLEAGISTTEPR